ncbi:siderophore-interacting protein [Myxococcus sp. K38C18041901]|uniref:siderophore-interacting protein n=1 Tax=Myxococcus guangdongensis TaxID=2906760 RepID=UPI0020A6FC1B|nr:siderophore-interacting protein [Myxococcus guangdongensis]MCP3059405.1 siderophore-interacting protein [Myxococcus guangdongensis]
MPQMPAVLANTLMPWFAKPSHVTHVEALSARLKRVRFEGASLRGVVHEPGHEVEFRVSATEFRHYTPSLLDAQHGIMEVVFYLHGQGPGSAWAQGLKAGDAVDILGPGGRLAVDPDADSHLFLGDETCLGLFQAMVRALPSPLRLSGAVEVEPGCEDWLEKVGVPLTAVTREPGGARGEALCAWLGRNVRKEATCYLAGHAGSIVRLRQELLERHGLDKRALRSKAYWADGKRGL